MPALGESKRRVGFLLLLHGGSGRRCRMTTTEIELRTSPVFLSARVWLDLKARAKSNGREDWEEVAALLRGREKLEGAAMTQDIRDKARAIRLGRLQVVKGG